MENLTNEELIKIAKEGNKKAREQLFIQNDKFNFYVAGQYKNYLHVTSMDELTSIARYGMLKAYNTFNLDAKNKFITYASRVMHNEIKMYIRQLNRWIVVSSLDEYEDNETKYGRAYGLYEFLESDLCIPGKDILDIEADSLMKKSVSRLLATLNEKENIIIKGLYYENKTQYEIAQELDLSQSYICRKHKSILKKLRIKGTKNIKGGMEEWLCQM